MRESYTARVSGNTSIKAGMSAPIVIREYVDPYEGPTTVVPNGTTQTLSTRGKTMAADVTVEPIPSNLAAGAIEINLASFSTLPQTVSNAAITADHVAVLCTPGTPSAQVGEWTVTTAAGSVTVSGSISGSTTLQLVLVQTGISI